MGSISSILNADDLSTFDPYDIWKTGIGYRVKDLYNRNRYVGTLPAAFLTLVDLYLNDRLRFGYKPQEYPIVRAWAALILLNMYEHEGGAASLESVGRHKPDKSRYAGCGDNSSIRGKIENHTGGT